ncbi:PDDEXK family nuclease, partial [Bacteroides hominis]
SAEQKEFEWKEKRRGLITASVLPDLMKAGKGTPFGKAALDVMFAVRYERRTGVTRENGTAKAFDWGHENEPLAVEWLRTQLLNEIKSCTTDFEDIVFNEPFEGFGDSPDA